MQVNAPIIAGAANNQLATALQAEQLAERGILYAPDFVLNAGGIIAVYYQRQHGGALSKEMERTMLAHITCIGATLEQVFKRASRDGCSPHAVAEIMAEEVLSNTMA